VQHALAAGFPFVAMGRALLREPDLVEKLRANRETESLCVHCNKCMPSIFAGTHCVLVEPRARPGIARMRIPAAPAG
jgi:2,4-dienoyl-CoA reductase-like NADH-dependent reductase (Old Yellow Enzyme family)